MTAKAEPRFRMRSELVEGAWVRHLVAHCACGTEAEVAASLTYDAAAISFRAFGWTIGHKPNQDRCPRCVRAERRKYKESYSMTAITADPARTAPPKLAEAPRTASVADRRRIADALEEHYDTKRGLYLQSWSDKALATKLDVPAAWVGDVRAMMFGAGEGNEAASARRDALSRLEADLTKLSDDFMSAVGRLETELKRLKLDSSYGG